MAVVAPLNTDCVHRRCYQLFPEAALRGVPMATRMPASLSPKPMFKAAEGGNNDGHPRVSIMDVDVSATTTG